MVTLDDLSGTESLRNNIFKLTFETPLRRPSMARLTKTDLESFQPHVLRHAKVVKVGVDRRSKIKGDRISRRALHWSRTSRKGHWQEYRRSSLGKVTNYIMQSILSMTSVFKSTSLCSATLYSAVEHDGIISSANVSVNTFKYFK